MVSVDAMVMMNMLVYVPRIFGITDDTTGYWRALLQRRLNYLAVVMLFSFLGCLRKLNQIYLFDMHAPDAALMLLIQTDLTLTFVHTCWQAGVVNRNVRAPACFAAIVVTRILLLALSFVTLVLAMARPNITMLFMGDIRGCPEIAISYIAYCCVTPMMFVVCIRNVVDDLVEEWWYSEDDDADVDEAIVDEYGTRIIVASRREEGRRRRAASSSSSPTSQRRRALIVECSICLDGFSIGETVTELPCAHVYHRECLATWFTRHQPARCPLCRHVPERQTV